MDKGRSVVITGASGFIGSRLVEDLSKNGWIIFALTSRPEKLIKNKNIVGIKCNWTDEGIKDAIMQLPNISFWIHAAAKIDILNGDPLHLYLQNSLLTQYLAEHICTRKNIFLIYLSTISVYGKSQIINLDVNPVPDTHYGLSKLLGEKFCQALLGERCLILRLAGVWGEELKPKLFVNRCFQNAKLGKTIVLKSLSIAQRNYLWVGDVPDIVEYAYSGKLSGIHLAAGPKAISICDMITAISKEFGVSVKSQKKDVSDKDLIVKSTFKIPTTEFNKSLIHEAHKNI